MKFHRKIIPEVHNNANSIIIPIIINYKFHMQYLFPRCSKFSTWRFLPLLMVLEFWFFAHLLMSTRRFTSRRQKIYIPKFFGEKRELLTNTCVLSIYCHVASAFSVQIKYYFFENNNTFFVNISHFFTFFPCLNHIKFSHTILMTDERWSISAFWKQYVAFHSFHILHVRRTSYHKSFNLAGGANRTPLL